MKRFIMAMLRDTPGPLTTLQITEARIAERGLQCDEKSRIVIRKRINAALISLRGAGTLRNGGIGADGFKAWMVG